MKQPFGPLLNQHPSMKQTEGAWSYRWNCHHRQLAMIPHSNKHYVYFRQIQMTTTIDNVLINALNQRLNKDLDE